MKLGQKKQLLLKYVLSLISEKIILSLLHLYLLTFRNSTAGLSINFLVFVRVVFRWSALCLVSVYPVVVLPLWAYNREMWRWKRSSSWSKCSRKLLLLLLVVHTEPATPGATATSLASLLCLNRHTNRYIHDRFCPSTSVECLYNTKYNNQWVECTHDEKK